MPTGLADALLENEFNDIIQFLSELGRTPEFSAGTNSYARTWRVLQNTNAAKDYLYEATPEAAIQPHETLTWVEAYSDITGAMPLRHVPSLRHRYWRKSHSFLKFTLEAAAPRKSRPVHSPTAGRTPMDSRKTNRTNRLDPHRSPIRPNRMLPNP